MVELKNQDQLNIMTEGGKKLSEIMKKLMNLSQQGVNLLTIEKKANELIKKAGGKPGFKKVANYDWATCLNVNKGIVHGIPKDYNLKKGDVFSLDIGMIFKGLNTDMCNTKVVGKNKETMDKEIKKFLETGKRALEKAVESSKPGNRVGHISQTIQNIIETAGYNCARNLTGHGIGKKLHEDPNIPCILKGEIDSTPELRVGMTLAIEVIYTKGDPNFYLAKDGWTIESTDGKITSVFEETIALTSKGVKILTPLPFRN